MPLEPDPTRAADLLARLDALRALTTEAEDDVLASLVVTGEPRAQRVLDDWLDQVADTLRSLGAGADALAPVLSRFATGRTATDHDADAGPGAESDARGVPDPRAAR